jgi:predicted nucleic acid-binding protein
MPSALVDTNVLVYAYDRSEPGKAARAIEALDFLQTTRTGRLSVQALAEFFVVATRGQAPLLKAAAASRQVDLLSRAFDVLPVTPMVVLEAIRGVRAHQFSYWDSQIWAVARLNQIPVILTEDFQIGRSIEGVRFVDPFASDVPVSSLV